MRHLPTNWAAVCLCALLGCGVEQADPELGQRQAAITDGVVHSGHPSVGLMLANGATVCGTQMHGSLCTVTLVGKRTLLTAAHCIDPADTYIVCFGAGTTYKPVKMVAHPGWDLSTKLNDIAVVVLDKDPPVTPSIVTWDPMAKGQQVTLVGYGTTGETLTDAGTKRIAVNTISEVEALRFSYLGSGGAVGNTCYGDSGGPAFATIGGKEAQVGVTSAGVKPCGTKGYSTRLDSFKSWLEQNTGGDLYTDLPDTQKPQVAITEPASGAKLTTGQVTVKISATDNVGIGEVELVVDGASAGKLTNSPYNITATLQDGAHTLRAVARDLSGNSGEAQVSVTVEAGSQPPQPPPPGSFGSKCDSNNACFSQLCGSYGPEKYCTQICDPASNPCPDGAECLPTETDRFVCGPPPATHSFDGQDVLLGGCQLGQAGGSLGALLGLGLLIGLALLRRGRLLRPFASPDCR